MADVNDTDVINGDEMPAQTSPAWMTTQAPKVAITKVDGGGDVRRGEGATLATLPAKTRKPRRTKAQMLADAAARADAENDGKIGYASAGPTPPMVEVEFTHPDMAREDTAHAVAVDLRGVRMAGFDSGRTHSKVQEYVPTTTTDRLAIVACLLALLALSVAIVALVR